MCGEFIKFSPVYEPELDNGDLLCPSVLCAAELLC